jgi:hypothetical protein
MSDRFPGEITIGGKLPAALLDEFLGEVTSTGASVGGYDGPAFDCKNADDLCQALDTDRHLVLADAEASYGQFEELEAFCVKHGLPFDRHSDAKYEFDSVNVRFRPGMNRPVEVPSDNCGEKPDREVVGRGRVFRRRLIRFLRTAVELEEEVTCGIV